MLGWLASRFRRRLTGSTAGRDLGDFPTLEDSVTQLDDVTRIKEIPNFRTQNSWLKSDRLFRKDCLYLLARPI